MDIHSSSSGIAGKEPVWTASTYRPWFGLYGRFVKPGKHRVREKHTGSGRPAAEVDGQGVRAEAVEIEEEEPLAPLLQLPDEIITLILSKLPSAYKLGQASTVCHDFKRLIENPRLWESGCVEAFAPSHPDKGSLQRLLCAHGGSWKQLFLLHPHLRFDGLFVSRNTYLKSGVREMVVKHTYKPVHVVIYYRYWRFFPDGTILYCTTPFPVAHVAKLMSGPRAAWLGAQASSSSSSSTQQQQHVFVGRYVIKGSKIWAVVRYPNSWSTEIRSLFLLRSTRPGANNRLDIEMIQSYDRTLRIGSSLLPASALQEQFGIEAADVDASPEAEPTAGEAMHRRHQRGLACAVFVPWDQVHTSVLNLPPSQMDFYVAG